MNRSNEELVKLYQSGNKSAIDELLDNNQGIIRKIASKYMRVNKRLEFDELFNSGVIGIIDAAKNYDFNNEKKAQFITYAVHHINRQIYICVNGRSCKEIENNKLYNSTKSLNTPIGEDEDIELIDTVQAIDNSFEDIEHKLYLKQLREELEEVMKDRLTLRQRDILQFRYGWNTKPMTLNEIGEILGITQERVRQIVAKSLRDMRKSPWLRTKGVEYADEIFRGSRLTYSNIERKIDFIDRYLIN